MSTLASASRLMNGLIFPRRFSNKGSTFLMFMSGYKSCSIKIEIYPRGTFVLHASFTQSLNQFSGVSSPRLPGSRAPASPRSQRLSATKVRGSPFSQTSCSSTLLLGFDQMRAPQRRALFEVLA